LVSQNIPINLSGKVLCGTLFLSILGIIVNTPPAKTGGFELRLKAGLIGPSAD
jgi:hypothetical protein